MGESQLELKERIGRLWDRYRELMPEVADAYDPLPAEVYKDGEVSGKHKRLQALCAALVKGCRACILYQADLALERGATADELLETAAVAVSLGGTMAAGETSRLVEFMQERGVI